jgi:probable rRNA maturation factor
MSPEGGKRATLLFRALPKQPRISSGDRRKLKQFADLLSENLAHEAGFTCLFTGDRELRRLNRFFLGNDNPTDVLSFPAYNGAGELGEMAISIERANAQAGEFGHSCLDEIRILMLHGLLHLKGQDHERDKGEMARAEGKWRRALGLPMALIARSRAKRGAGKR